MARDEVEDGLPDRDVAKEFYAKYEPKEILGRGVSSTVRRCVEKDTGIEYAAKIIDISGDSDDPDGSQMREATRREVHILRMVAGHPYIIELHDVFESFTFFFLVFELCKNGELFDYLTNVVTLSEKKTKQIMKQLLEAVQCVHRKGIVHRDIKPENILLDDDFNIKLTDFGFAKVMEPDEQLYELCGTPGYLAPELLKAAMYENMDGYGVEVDTWACGVIMYTLLVGCPPFWHRKQMVMLRNIMEGIYNFHRPEWEDITEAPKHLISKLLTVDPKHRVSVSEALKHEFFQSLYAVDRVAPRVPRQVSVPLLDDSITAHKFEARKKFKVAILFVRAAVRLRRLHLTPEPLSVEVACIDPYRIKTLRKVIDACAFRVYGHWVKKVEAQNRAALFENTPRIELKQQYDEEQQSKSTLSP